MLKHFLVLVTLILTPLMSVASSGSPSGADIYAKRCIIDGKLWTKDMVQCPLYHNMSNKAERDKYQRYLDGLEDHPADE